MIGQVLQKEHYETYTMSLPFLVFGAKRRGYIAHELEKLHPCFSEQCCYDTRTVLKNGKRLTEVTVMNRLILERYRSKSKGPLYVADKKRHRVFYNKASVYLWLFIFLLLLLIPFYAIFFAKKITVRPSPLSTNFEPVAIEVTHKTDARIYDILFATLCAVKNNAGSVMHLFVDADLDYANLALEVKDVFPECLEECIFSANKDAHIECSNIMYDSGKPHFTFSAQFLSTLPATQETDFSDAQISMLRSVLQKHTSLYSEEKGAGLFKCSIENHAFVAFFENLNVLEKEWQIGVKSIMLDRGEKATECTIVFLPFALGEHNFVKAIPECSEAFFRIEKNQNPLPAVTKKNTAGEVIGKVKASNGKTIFYMRYSDGKIREVIE